MSKKSKLPDPPGFLQPPMFFEGRGTDDLCCGGCSWFDHEDVDGVGVCYLYDRITRCSDVCLSCKIDNNDTNKDTHNS